MITTLFMLLYGDYASLHRRVLAPLATQPTDRVGVRLWLNTVCSETLQWVLANAPPEWLIYVSDQNVPKYKVMRYLFTDQRNAITTPWVTWFDDDTIINKDDWLPQTVAFTSDNPDVALFGRQCVKPHLPGIEAWIRKAQWYRKRDFQRREGEKRRIIRFIQGSYWWLRTNAMRAMDWPDPRLNHNGGDTALSEAAWQHRFGQADYTYGVDVDCADRRGMTERPAGSKSEAAYASDNSRPMMVDAMLEYRRLIAVSGRPGELVTPHILLLSPSGAPIEMPTSDELRKARLAKEPIRSRAVTQQDKPKPSAPRRPAKRKIKVRKRLQPTSPMPKVPPPKPPKAKPAKKKAATLKQMLEGRRRR